ncbi:tumor necrosis factor receptor superfamily member 14 isoform X2 [Dendropsophus ebraccatus]|uniref:tumor necrosis factor receptor superfamily member 14 isoform X2 n=1 Tax=Dendropsophus ebraccatus TaxID=150705 RepID=UPI0038313522
MDYYFLLLTVYLLVWDCQALTCLPREYTFNNVCCPMCDKGSFVKTHCISSSSSSVCVICADNTYMDHPNGLTACFRCKECDAGSGQIIKERCTTTSDTKCECKPGYFCMTQDCDLCQLHTPCPPGQYIKEPGTGWSDTVCAECQPRHYSNRSNSVQCFPWKKCSDSGLVHHKDGNSTADSTCIERRGRPGIAISFVLWSLVIAVGFAIKYYLKQMKILKPVDTYENPKPVDTYAENLKPGDTYAENRKSVDTFVEYHDPKQEIGPQRANVEISREET